MKKINDEYDIGKAFEAIEDELIASMIRNMRRHKAEEVKEDKQWAMWQAEQLEELEKYKKDNQKKYGKQFKDINAKIKELIRIAWDEGEMEQENEIMKAIQKGFRAKKVTSGANGEFFKLNDRKLDALIKAVVSDMEKAETAVLRMANDQYRRIIYNAQVYANTGAGTYEKAVDMATKDFLSAGLNCIQYANGARHTIADYADMAIRTAAKRAYLQGEGQKRQEWEIHTVIVNKRGNPCPKCLPFCGKVLIDDVWSGGSRKDGSYPLMSYAIERGLYHPRCKDVHTTYFPGISTADDTWTEEELEAIGLKARQEAKQQYANRQAEKYERLAKYSLDEENQRQCRMKAEKWKHVKFRTGELNTKEYIEEKRKDQFLGPPKEITSEWLLSKNTESSVTELMEYSIDGVTYKVDGKRIVLDYSEHEKEVAGNISRLYKKNVQMIPRITYPQGISTPDFKIDGDGWDLKTISTAGKNVLYNAVKKKKRQACNFIFDITECPLDADELKQQINNLFRSTHLTFIDRIAIYKDNEIVGVYKRNK